MKSIREILRPRGGHWVGDGFPVRSLFSYHPDAEAVSPFLLFDYAGPYTFEPSARRRGVGPHPHRGFETVTIVFEGEVAHRDTTGSGGIIGPGDVQWMTAAGGVLHDEFHSPAFTARGGDLRMVQLWVNLPAKHKLADPGYQAITAADIPVVALPDGAGEARVIAGTFAGEAGPARTFTPVDVWDLRLQPEARTTLRFPEGHTALLAVLTGELRIGEERVGEAEVARLTREGEEVEVQTTQAAQVLALSGAPIQEPVVGHGPFVMNSAAEIQRAIDDFNSGRFGHLAG